MHPAVSAEGPASLREAIPDIGGPGEQRYSRMSKVEVAALCIGSRPGVGQCAAVCWLLRAQRLAALLRSEHSHCALEGASQTPPLASPAPPAGKDAQRGGAINWAGVARHFGYNNSGAVKNKYNELKGNPREAGAAKKKKAEDEGERRPLHGAPSGLAVG